MLPGRKGHRQLPEDKLLIAEDWTSFKTTNN